MAFFALKIWQNISNQRLTLSRQRLRHVAKFCKVQYVNTRTKYLVLKSTRFWKSLKNVTIIYVFTAKLHTNTIGNFHLSFYVTQIIDILCQHKTKTQYRRFYLCSKRTQNIRRKIKFTQSCLHYLQIQINKTWEFNSKSRM